MVYLLFICIHSHRNTFFCIYRLSCCVLKFGQSSVRRVINSCVYFNFIIVNMPRKRANENITLAGTGRDNSVPGSSSQVDSLFEEFSGLNLGTDDCSSPRCSRKCGRCGLCGNNGALENMVWETNHVSTLNERTVELKNT